jgi:hypothetical protein
MGYREFTANPSLATVIVDHVRAHLDELHTAMPARVESYDPATQRADVQPLVKDALPDEEAPGGVRAVSFPVIPGVPVLFPGGGGFRVTWPLQRGDGVLLVFSEVSLDVWKHGPPGEVVDPEAYWRHHLADAVALPGLRPFTQPWTGASTTELTVGLDGGLQLRIGPSSIDLGGGATDYVAMASKVDAALGALKTTISAWMPLPGDGGAALKTALLALFASWPAPVGSGLVKVR